jgi:hypothetical protein
MRIAVWTSAWWVFQAYSPGTHNKRIHDSGGANEAVIRMLISIGSPENVPAFLESVKKREKVLSGFGHR